MNKDILKKLLKPEESYKPAIMVFIVSFVFLAIQFNFKIKFPIFEPKTITTEHAARVTKLGFGDHRLNYIWFDYLGVSYRAPCDFEYQYSDYKDICQFDVRIMNPDIIIKKMTFMQPFSTEGYKVILINGVFLINGKEVPFFTTSDAQTAFFNIEYLETRFYIAVFFVSLIYIIICRFICKS